ncbi:MBL fold metallo-hydrolase [Leucobacter sp. wl10]|uniref:MBL fold metallo-hydrolase n=1 Tax=Leucobacter sp. wl10 TaxID=2304677 RepID=UPI000E5AE93F|nr:MBL fold metallo-hydrolase [Leucobacter sp. wl10]RGE24202.1 MBL fold metallo-hydrolase [Leucobacter sp. wl10]
MSGGDFGLEVLGCNATAPSASGPASGYVLHSELGAILVDAGPGTMAAYAARYELERVRAIVVTHMHADHSLDLMAWAYRWTFPAARERIPLYLPRGAEQALRGFDELYGIPTLPGMHRPIEQSFRVTTLEMDGDTRHELPGWTMISFEARHAVPSAALRFERAGRAVAFSSDTGDCPGVRAAAAGSDLFVCEATWIDEPDADSAGHGHLTAAQAGRIALEVGTRSLLVTHLADRSASAEALRLAAEQFGGPVRIATAGMRL